ncbi:MAG: serine hydrolase [Lachnospiraceae bacterium]|nr:serine hydrolase [Lachnospiraceae bacterium]
MDLSRGFEKFTQDIVNNDWKVFGCEVYEDGKLSFSFGDTKDNRHQIYSATKTVLSLAAGIAIDNKKIDVDKDILYYLPKKYTDGMQTDLKERFKKLTLHRLMTMSVPGFPFRAEGDDFVEFSLNCTDIKEDEVSFDYSNIPAYLTGVALSEAMDTDLCEFIDKNILNPLGVYDAGYTRSPEGYFYGASGMELTVNDLSKVGLLLYNKGVYEDKRIVSKEYVSKATSVLQMNREGGYGYYIWKYKDGFAILGKWKQKCYILPKRKLIITYLSDIRDDSHDLIQSMERNILGE